MYRGFWRGLLLAGVIGIAASLSACSFSVPDTPNASNSSSPKNPALESPAPKSTYDPTAAVTIAGVDVDGQNVTVAGLVAGVSEAGGSCRFVLSSGLTGAEVEAATIGQDNGSNTSCGATQIPIEQMSKGPWSVVLHYASNTLTLDSAGVKLEIP